MNEKEPIGKTILDMQEAMIQAFDKIVKACTESDRQLLGLIKIMTERVLQLEARVETLELGNNQKEIEERLEALESEFIESDVEDETNYVPKRKG